MGRHTILLVQTRGRSTRTYYDFDNEPAAIMGAFCACRAAACQERARPLAPARWLLRGQEQTPAWSSFARPPPGWSADDPTPPFPFHVPFLPPFSHHRHV
jgi:hypothetical protein